MVELGFRRGSPSSAERRHKQRHEMPSASGHHANSLLELVELTGTEPVTS